MRGKSDSETAFNHVIAAFVPFTLGAPSAVALIAWWALRNLNAGFANMNNVLLGACPCTLGIANQVPWSIAKWVSLKHGVLIQRNRAVELLPQIKQFAFDKTGTLTELTISDFKIFEN